MKSMTLFVLTVMSIGFSTSVHGQTPSARNNDARACGTSEFRLGPDDVIEVSVYQDKDLGGSYPVRPDGKVSIPLVGELPASGKTATELQKELVAKYARFIADPAVTVIVKEVNSSKVSIVGEVKTPGVYKIQDRATIVDALALAGGWTEYSKKKAIVWRTSSAGAHPMKVDLQDYIKGKSQDAFCVQPYDKIVVQ